MKPNPYRSSNKRSQSSAEPCFSQAYSRSNAKDNPLQTLLLGGFHALQRDFALLQKDCLQRASWPTSSSPPRKKCRSRVGVRLAADETND
jgi:hypothetical protein